MKTLTISIGNSDDRLTQAEWAVFWADVALTVRETAQQVHGEFVSLPTSRWQNACWVVDATGEQHRSLIMDLGTLARRYRQDAIALTVGTTVMVTGPVVD